VSAKDFGTEEVLKAVKKEMKLMKDLAVSIRDEADEAKDPTMVATFEGYIAYYEKQLWFIQAILKD